MQLVVEFHGTLSTFDNFRMLRKVRATAICCPHGPPVLSQLRSGPKVRLPACQTGQGFWKRAFHLHSELKALSHVPMTILKSLHGSWGAVPLGFPYPCKERGGRWQAAQAFSAS